MIWLGVAIVIGTFWLIYKNYEARLVLIRYVDDLDRFHDRRQFCGFSSGNRRFCEAVCQPRFGADVYHRDGLRLCDELHEVCRSLGQCLSATAL